MRKFLLVLISISVICTCCNLFKKRAETPPVKEQKTKVYANSIALNISMEGEDTVFLSTDFKDMLAVAFKTRGIITTKDIKQVTDLMLAGRLTLMETERTRIYGPDKFTYTVRGEWRLIRRKDNKLVLYEKLNKSAVQLGREASIVSAVKVAVSDIVSKVSEIMFRSPKRRTYR